MGGAVSGLYLYGTGLAQQGTAHLRFPETSGKMGFLSTSSVQALEHHFLL